MPRPAAGHSPQCPESSVCPALSEQEELSLGCLILLLGTQCPESSLCPALSEQEGLSLGCLVLLLGRSPPCPESIVQR